MVEGLTDMIISSQRGFIITSSKTLMPIISPLRGRKDFPGFSPLLILGKSKRGDFASFTAIPSLVISST
jgi:hypothetical protein